MSLKVATTLVSMAFTTLFFKRARIDDAVESWFDRLFGVASSTACLAYPKVVEARRKAFWASIVPVLWLVSTAIVLALCAIYAAALMRDGVAFGRVLLQSLPYVAGGCSALFGIAKGGEAHLRAAHQIMTVLLPAARVAFHVWPETRRDWFYLLLGRMIIGNTALSVVTTPSLAEFARPFSFKRSQQQF